MEDDHGEWERGQGIHGAGLIVFGDNDDSIRVNG